MKTLITLSLIIILIVSFIIPVYAYGWIDKAKECLSKIDVFKNYVTVIVDGNKLELPIFLAHKNNGKFGERIYIPLRESSEKLGYNIKWDDSTKSAHVITNVKEKIIEKEIIKYVCMFCKDSDCNGVCKASKYYGTDYYNVIQNNINIEKNKVIQNNNNKTIQNNNKSCDKSKKSCKSKK